MSMHLQGVEYITQISTQPKFQAKLVFNEHGAIFFPVTQEHRHQSGPNIHYADNYKGNALAAMVMPGKIEVRYHKDFTDEQVSSMLSNILSHTQLECLADFATTYQGRVIRTP